MKEVNTGLFELNILIIVAGNVVKMLEIAMPSIETVY